MFGWPGNRCWMCIDTALGGQLTTAFRDAMLTGTGHVQLKEAVMPRKSSGGATGKSGYKPNKGLGKGPMRPSTKGGGGRKKSGYKPRKSGY